MSEYIATVRAYDRRERACKVSRTSITCVTAGGLLVRIACGPYCFLKVPSLAADSEYFTGLFKVHTAQTLSF